MPPYGVGRPRTIFRALRERDARPVQQLRSDIPDALAAICMRALDRDKHARFPNAESLCNALNDFLATLADEPAEVEQVPGLEISEGLDSGEIVRGWNDDDVAPSQDPLAGVALEPVSEVAAPKPYSRRTSTRRHRKGGSRRNKHRAPALKVPKGGTAKLRRMERLRRSEGLEAIGRVMAFCGPAAAAVVGLLLLL